MRVRYEEACMEVLLMDEDIRTDILVESNYEGPDVPKSITDPVTLE